jgi:hypothetical protein
LPGRLSEHLQHIVVGVPRQRETRRTAGVDIGGYEQRPDWPKVGPSLLIGACLILAVRTAKWPPRPGGGTESDRELDDEVENAIRLAGWVLSSLVAGYADCAPDLPGAFGPDRYHSRFEYGLS